MAPSTSKKRKLDDAITSKRSISKKKARKQQHYSSPSPTPSGDEFPAVDLADSDASPPSPHANIPNNNVSSTSSSKSESDLGSESSSSNTSKRRTRKRNDPSAFSTSMAKILSSKLSTSKRADPVLARSSTAALANAEIANEKLEKKARQKLRKDRKLEFEKGRVKDLILGTDAGLVEGDDGVENAAELREQEKKFRKTAQRGVVKLFNAVRAAQIKGEEAARKGGAAGRKKERVEEMSKQGFLELVAGGGKNGKDIIIEET